MNAADLARFNALCDVHHRHHAVGIHSVAARVWNAQPLLNAQARKRLARGTRV